MLHRALELICIYVVSYGLLLIVIELRTRFDRSFLSFGGLLILLSLFAYIDAGPLGQEGSPERFRFWMELQHGLFNFIAVLLLWYVMTLAGEVRRSLLAAVATYGVLTLLPLALHLFFEVRGDAVYTTRWYFLLLAPYYLFGGFYSLRALIRAWRTRPVGRLLRFHVLGLTALTFAGTADVAQIAFRPLNTPDFPSFITLGLLAYGVSSTFVFTDQLLSLIEERNTLRQLSDTDPLTGIGNFRTFQKHLSEACRAGPFGLLLIDLDWFKRVNDEHGHLMGDRVLREVAAQLVGVTREADLCTRYGGEEFAILVASADEAARTAERIREAIEGLSIINAGVRIPVTVSIGCALCPQHALEPTALIEAADRALYASKRAGRNRVTMSSNDSPEDPLVQTLRA